MSYLCYLLPTLEYLISFVAALSAHVICIVSISNQYSLPYAIFLIASRFFFLDRFLCFPKEHIFNVIFQKAIDKHNYCLNKVFIYYVFDICVMTILIRSA